MKNNWYNDYISASVSSYPQIYIQEKFAKMMEIDINLRKIPEENTYLSVR